MDLLTIAGTIVTVLSPYLVKGGEKFAAEVGNAAFQKAKSLWESITRHFRNDDTAKKTLSDFKEKPPQHAGALAAMLQEGMQGNPEFAAELNKYINDLGPALEIIQEFEEARNLVGVRVKKFRKGSAKIIQKGNKIEGGTGADIEEFG